MKHVRVDTVSIKDAHLNEAWVQQHIAENLGDLGLGEVELRDKERRQPHAGRLDLLLQDPESDKRYEVEIQLGPTDESHIIRTIEYWDVERKRYPQYEHCAVIVAEQITGRLLNVINLFNGTIPLVAIQMTAIKMPDGIGLTFAKVIDELVRGPVDGDEQVNEVKDRAYWEKRVPKPILGIADEILSMAKAIDPSCEHKYNKYYIGMAQGGVTNNFVWWEPKKSWALLCFRIPQDEHLTTEIEEARINLMNYKWGAYRLRLKPDDLKLHAQLVGKLLSKAYENR
jgi:hypothetical protein